MIPRGPATMDWISLYPNVSVIHMPAIASDHCPILLSLNSVDTKMPFKFEEMWMEDSSCHSVISDSWNTKILGSPSYILNGKIRVTKDNLKIWNKEHFGNCHSKAKEIKDKIDAVQLLDKTDTNAACENALKMELDDWLHRIDIFWQQKAKDKWLMDGDANTSYNGLSKPYPDNLDNLIGPCIDNLDNSLLSDLPSPACIKKYYFLLC
ncbi:hypothetical protein CASFOL_033944 [Castilleja foliolosa]|uniref:Uncharacterized protein n=1 Tax=Castilleja foliolosa TaxID=1961234 RepID=A0ABD3BZ92_9LAMI